MLALARSILEMSLTASNISAFELSFERMVLIELTISFNSAFALLSELESYAKGLPVNSKKERLQNNSLFNLSSFMAVLVKILGSLGLA
jgi:hypothetical protein